MDLAKRPRMRTLFVLLPTILLALSCDLVKSRVDAADGYKAYNAKEWKASVESYQSALKAAPNNEKLRRNLGYAALAAAHEAKDPSLANAYYDLTITTLLPLLTQIPSDSDLSSALMDAWSGSNRLADAAVYVKKRLSEVPGDDDALRMLGTIQLRMGDYSGAVATYQSRINKTPNNAQLLASYGTICWEWLRAGGPTDKDQAIQVATSGYDAAFKADSLDPTLPTALVYAGLLLRERAKRQTDPNLVQQDIEKADALLAKVRARRVKEEQQKANGAKNKGASTSLGQIAVWGRYV